MALSVLHSALVTVSCKHARLLSLHGPQSIRETGEFCAASVVPTCTVSIVNCTLRLNNLADLYRPVASVGSRQRLRSATRGDLVVSPTITHFGARSFAVARPKAWNQLPADIRAIDSVNSFKSALKTFLFR